MRVWSGVFGVVVILAGCRGGSPAGSGPEAEANSYHLSGKVLGVDAAHVTVEGNAIPGLMEAMTMPYRLVDPTVGSELHPGDTITARVLADRDAAGPKNVRLDEIVVVGQAQPNAMPAVRYHVPAVGDAVPDFRLLNQSGKEIHLAQFRGRVLLLTFIYTRCPLAEFCPRMSENFAAIDKSLAADKTVYKKTHLLSISFDPKYDTPTVLRSYGGAHTGKFTDEDFAHWDFAAPSVSELSRVEQFFNVGVTGADEKTSDPSSIQHSLSTVLMNKDGKIIGWYPSNEWRVGDMVEAVKKAAQ